MGHRLDPKVVLPHFSGGRWSSLWRRDDPTYRRPGAAPEITLSVTRRLSTRDLMEEFCALEVWPLTPGAWSFGDPKGGLLPT